MIQDDLHRVHANCSLCIHASIILVLMSVPMSARRCVRFTRDSTIPSHNSFLPPLSLTRASGMRSMQSSPHSTLHLQAVPVLRFLILCGVSAMAVARVPLDITGAVMFLLVATILQELRMLCVQCVNDKWVPEGWHHIGPWSAILLPLCACEYLGRIGLSASAAVLYLNVLPHMRKLAAFNDGSLLYPLTLLLCNQGAVGHAFVDVAAGLLMEFYVVHNAAIWMRIIEKRRRVSAAVIGTGSAVMLVRRAVAFMKILHPSMCPPHVESCPANGWLDWMSASVAVIYVLHRSWQQMCVAINPPCPRMRPHRVDLFLRELPSDGGTGALVLYGHMARADYVYSVIPSLVGGYYYDIWFREKASVACLRALINDVLRDVFPSARDVDDVTTIVQFLNGGPRFGAVVRGVAPNMGFDENYRWEACARSMVSKAVSHRDAPLLRFLLERTNIDACTVMQHTDAPVDSEHTRICECVAYGAYECLDILLQTPRMREAISDAALVHAATKRFCRNEEKCIPLLMSHLPTPLLLSMRADTCASRKWVEQELRARRRWGRAVSHDSHDVSSYSECGRCVVVNALQMISRRRTSARGRELLRP